MITICLTAAFRGPSIAPPLALRTARRAKVFASGADVRLDKLLAERGAGSRKDVDRLIRKGLVELDGEVVPKNGAKLKIPYESSPIVDGFEYPPPPLLAAYHKPLGVVSTMKDDQGRSDLATVLPLNWQKSLMPVGRLDADTTGCCSSVATATWRTGCSIRSMWWSASTSRAWRARWTRRRSVRG